MREEHVHRSGHGHPEDSEYLPDEQHQDRIDGDHGPVTTTEEWKFDRLFVQFIPEERKQDCMYSQQDDHLDKYN